MKATDEVTMPCPRCKAQHPASNYVPRPELAKKPLGKVMPSGVRSGTPYAPLDVQCSCGATLRCVVPIFKVSDCGWEWRIL